MTEIRTVLATTSSFGADGPEVTAPLEGDGLRLVPNPFGRKLSEAELAQLLRQHRPVGLLAGTEPVTAAVLRAASSHLQVVSRVGVGWDNVDRGTARELGIRVYRTEGVLTQAVAELTVGLILAGLRHIASSDRHVREGRWQKTMGGLLFGKTVGIIGFGGIGRRVGELVRAFGTEVVFYDPLTVEVDWARPLPLPELLERADIVTLHASGKTPILGRAELDRICGRGVVLVNTARGELVDEDALRACLAEDGLGFACLDVFREEPYSGPLCALENVILTPHIGSYAREARAVMERTAVENLLAGLREGGRE